MYILEVKVNHDSLRRFNQRTSATHSRGGWSIAIDMAIEGPRSKTFCQFILVSN